MTFLMILLTASGLGAFDSALMFPLPEGYEYLTMSAEETAEAASAARDVNSSEPANPGGVTPLMFAVSGGPDETAAKKAEILLKAGADPNRKNVEGRTALHYAARQGHILAMTVLLEAGAEIDPVDQDGWTPLALLCGNLERNRLEGEFMGPLCCVHKPEDLPDETRVAGLRLLISRGADARSDRGGLYRGMRADRNVRRVFLWFWDEPRPPLTWAARDCGPEVIRLLLESGGQVNQADIVGVTPLHLAASNLKAGTAALLLSAGAKADVRDSFGVTPLMSAAWASNTEVLVMLLAAGAEADRISDDGFTALMYAAVNSGDAKVVRLLLAAGVDPARRDQVGRTALDLVEQNRPRALVEIRAILEAALKSGPEK